MWSVSYHVGMPLPLQTSIQILQVKVEASLHLPKCFHHFLHSLESSSMVDNLKRLIRRLWTSLSRHSPYSQWALGRGDEKSLGPFVMLKREESQYHSILRCHFIETRNLHARWTLPCSSFVKHNVSEPVLLPAWDKIVKPTPLSPLWATDLYLKETSSRYITAGPLSCPVCTRQLVLSGFWIRFWNTVSHLRFSPSRCFCLRREVQWLLHEQRR
jgi:hypothetical protein